MTSRTTLSIGLPACLLLLALACVPRAGVAQAGALPSGLYRLDAGSTFQAGCFDPCLCPIMAEVPTLGTLELAFAGTDGLFDVYEVSDVNWTVLLYGSELRVVGSGKYRVGGEFALVQQLELALQLGDQPAQHFDSGLVPAGGGAPIDITISVNGMVCHDTVFALRASPVPLGEILPYRLEPGSTFQRGCVGLCDCPAGEPLPLRGRFGLVALSREPVPGELASRFAVVGVRWRVGLDESAAVGVLPLRGFGSYGLGSPLVPQQRLILDLEIGSEPAARFDSGLVDAGARFPRIDVRVANGDPECFETVIDVEARPMLRKRRR